MKLMIQKVYSSMSLDSMSGSIGDRKKLKRQSTINSEAGLDMTDISQNSLLCGMKEFDRAVQNMEDTILVPSRLMDMNLSEAPDQKQRVPPLLQSADAYDVFQLVKSVRAQVRRGAVEPEPEAASDRQGTFEGGLMRRPSTLSSHSLSSLASETSSSGSMAGADSGVEAGSEAGDDAERCERVRAEFAAHLTGLAKCLAQMTDAATFLSTKYEQALNQ